MNYRIVKYILECIKNQLCLDSFAACPSDGVGGGENIHCKQSIRRWRELSPHGRIILYLSFIKLALGI